MQFTQEQMDKAVTDAVAKATEGLMNQAQIDSAIESRLNRERSKFGDYEDLKKFKEEHKIATDKKNQEDLEASKKYDEAKQGYETKIGEMAGVISSKDVLIKNMQITTALTNEIVGQNGFVEETLALLRQSTVIDENGGVFIKGKDANNIDAKLSIADGVKDFLTKRPHLVKAGGTGGSGGTGGAGAGSGDGKSANLAELNTQLMQARNTGDMKRANELKIKIAAILPGNRNAA